MIYVERDRDWRIVATYASPQGDRDGIEAVPEDDAQALAFLARPFPGDVRAAVAGDEVKP